MKGRDPLNAGRVDRDGSNNTTTTISQYRSHLQVTLYPTLHGVRWEILSNIIDTGTPTENAVESSSRSREFAVVAHRPFRPFSKSFSF
jgi:hypothetical protein